jgi:hypothetical protein
MRLIIGGRQQEGLRASILSLRISISPKPFQNALYTVQTFSMTALWIAKFTIIMPILAHSRMPERRVAIFAT